MTLPMVKIRGMNVTHILRTLTKTYCGKKIPKEYQKSPIPGSSTCKHCLKWWRYDELGRPNAGNNKI